MTHSPAPWILDVWYHDEYKIKDATGEPIHYDYIINQSDAALIVASPDLLAAAKEAAKQLEWSYDVETLKDKEAIAALKQLKAAISKAEPNEIT